MLAQFSGFEDVELATLLPFAGLALGLVFGVLAQRSRFCLRSAVIGSEAGRLAPMAGLYAAAMLVAVIGVQALSVSELVLLEDTRFRSDNLPLGALLAGGLMFGAGMILTRGCASRLTVLSAQGNLRAATVMMIFGIVAYAALKGVLAAPRMAFTDATSVETGGEGSLAALTTLSPLVLAGLIAVGLGFIIRRSGARAIPLLAGAGVGLVIIGGWFATGALLYDDFDPRAADSIAFTAGAADGLFYVMASSAVTPSFFAGAIGGVLVGAFLAAAASRELSVESFEDPQQTLRYVLGAVLMGVGGVMAGGCTIGAGLTGASTLSVAPVIALLAIIAGAAVTHRLVDAARPATGGAYAVAAE